LQQEWQPRATYLSWHQLDDAVWKAINDWVKNHRPPLNFRMIIAIVIINQSSSGIQVSQGHIPPPPLSLTSPVELTGLDL
jgi:hypothetical protein